MHTQCLMMCVLTLAKDLKKAHFLNVAGNFLTISSKTGLIFFSEHRSVDLLWQMQVFMHLV